MAREIRLPAACTLLAAALAGCSGSSATKGHPPNSGTSPDGAPSGLRTALGHIANTSDTRGFVTFSRPQAACAANGGTRTGHSYVRAIDLGDDLGNGSAQVLQALGINVTTAGSAVSALVRTHPAVVLSRLDDVSGLTSGTSDTAVTIRTAFASGKIELNGQRSSDILKQPQVTVIGGPAHLVRLTAHPFVGGAGRLFDAFRELSSLLTP
jgi:hypothetical protein